jgi:hypothetical protein
MNLSVRQGSSSFTFLRVVVNVVNEKLLRFLSRGSAQVSASLLRNDGTVFEIIERSSFRRERTPESPEEFHPKMGPGY